VDKKAGKTNPRKIGERYSSGTINSSGCREEKVKKKKTEKGDPKAPCEIRRADGTSKKIQVRGPTSQHRKRARLKIEKNVSEGKTGRGGKRKKKGGTLKGTKLC